MAMMNTIPTVMSIKILFEVLTFYGLVFVNFLKNSSLLGATDAKLMLKLHEHILRSCLLSLMLLAFRELQIAKREN